MQYQLLPTQCWPPNIIFVSKKVAFESGLLLLRDIALFRTLQLVFDFAEPYYQQCVYRLWDHLNCVSNQNEKYDNTQVDFGFFFLGGEGGGSLIFVFFLIRIIDRG